MGSINDKHVNIDKENCSIVFDKTNCDNCGICRSMCSFNVGVYGFSNLKYPCINCGSCIMVCPNKCLSEKDETDKLRDLLHSGKTVVFQVAPAVRASLGEEFGMKLGTNVEGKIISSLRFIGADYVFDTTFGADLTTMEEANELVYRIKNKVKGPMLSSCCPSWVKFVEMFYPEYLGNLSTCKSPISMEGTMIKKYFSKVNNIDEDDIVSIAVTPCTSKKMEILKYNDIDLVITTRELAKYLKEERVDFVHMNNGTFNSLMSKGSGSSVIYGTSGGVTESIIREVYYILTKRKPKGRLLNFKEVRGLANIKEASIKINGINLKIAVINGTGDARKVLDKINKNEVYYDFIEVMTCEGGCISGGGQPRVYPITNEVKLKRMSVLYNSDNKMKIRLASDNPDIKAIYDNYLGEPLGELSHKYLHNKEKKEE